MKTKIYTYVPPCPHCGSTITGRFINREYVDNYMSRALKRGELVQPALQFDERNLYCEECGFEWKGETKIKLLSRQEIEEQKHLRNIQSEDSDNYKQYLKNEKNTYIKEQHDEKWNARKRKLKKLFPKMF